VVAAIVIFALGTNFYPYFYSHYIAGIACLFVLIGVTGLKKLSDFNSGAARIIVFVCFIHFFFWYGLHALRDEQMLNDMTRYETWDAINHGDLDGRIAINRRLAAMPSKQLVFVRYWPPHQFIEWVHNAADIDGSRIVWARDLGAEENEKLRGYYPDRQVWLLEPDFRPPRLTPYASEVKP
jgi:hypothetical protein